ncbi:hypothetical protein GLP21_12215 [Photobacterium carnosum]|uniref:Uncharacterized protein n=1 Tax=Photobacterium carnosum TaxID=2023717 RepID=A0A2N4UW57_9GAMM|nr:MULTISPECIES: hypothetical protein [Photobacterium]MCD9475830.1 hypothetical protein [Photobacterium phosphoreum]MCD9485881.1 hypothetical protein [Photobacterium iliopiscarium]MCD9507692.1 hypothetical protein [Photobacterium phosphoreum]MCD9538187.1 hypothetical protein [Photobacterium carnosum]MCD9542991.1 hypothetical protein [Photobacterium carnosum]
MSYGKLAAGAVALLAATGIGYCFGGEKFKKEEERSDYKSGYNNGKAENINSVKTANDNADKAIKANEEYVYHQNQIIALITIGTAVAGCKQIPIPTNIFTDISQAAGGLSVSNASQETRKKAESLMKRPVSIRSAISVANRAGLSKSQCIEMIEVAMSIDGKPNDKQYAFRNEWSKVA